MCSPAKLAFARGHCIPVERLNLGKFWPSNKSVELAGALVGVSAKAGQLGLSVQASRTSDQSLLNVKWLSGEEEPITMPPICHPSCSGAQLQMSNCA